MQVTGRKMWMAGGLLVAAAAGVVGVETGAQRAAVQQQQVEPTALVQDVVQGTELYTAGHTYRVVQANVQVNRWSCDISPVQPEDITLWTKTMRTAKNQHLPETRSNWLDLTAQPPLWKMDKGTGGVSLPAGKIDTEICNRAFDGWPGTTYVKLVAPAAPTPPADGGQPPANTTPATAQAYFSMLVPPPGSKLATVAGQVTPTAPAPAAAAPPSTGN